MTSLFGSAAVRSRSVTPSPPLSSLPLPSLRHIKDPPLCLVTAGWCARLWPELADRAINPPLSPPSPGGGRGGPPLTAARGAATGESADVDADGRGTADARCGSPSMDRPCWAYYPLRRGGGGRLRPVFRSEWALSGTLTQWGAESHRTAAG